VGRSDGCGRRGGRSRILMSENKEKSQKRGEGGDREEQKGKEVALSEP